MTVIKDPIERMIENIETIKISLEELSARSEPVTAQDLNRLLAQVKNSPTQLDSNLVASKLLPKLLEGLPNKNDLNAQVEAIRKAGQEAAEQVRRAGAGIPSRVFFSGEVLGFTSWKAFFGYIGILLIVTLGLGGWAIRKHTEVEKGEVYREFSNWVIAKYPKVYDAWKKSYE